MEEKYQKKKINNTAGKPKYIELINSQKNEKLLQIDNKYYFYKTYTSKTEDKITWKCINYKNKSIRCDAMIKTDSKNNILEWKNIHNHLTDRIEFQRKRVKSEIKKKINSNNNPFLLNPKKVYDEALAKENSSLVPSYNSIKSGIYRQINKNIPKEPENIEDIPDDFPGFKTNEDKIFLIYRDKDIMVLQSENMAKILDAYPKDLFADSTFKICPKPFSQLLVLRVNDYFHNTFHTVCFILMKNKTKFLYMKGLVKMKCIKISFG